MKILLRVVVGAALAVLFTGALWLGPPGFSLAIMLFALGALWEFYGLGQAMGARPYRFTGMAAALILMVYAHYRGLDAGGLLVIAGSVLAILALHPFLAGAESRSWHDAAFTLTGYLYTALAGAAGIALRNERGFTPAALLFFSVWCFDIAAYFTGKFLGRHRIFPRISPSKTWEGLGGGLVLAWGAAALLNLLLGWPWHKLLIVTGITVLVGHLGDFFESSIKREAGVKDSSRLLPGHGGVLDRIDALLFAAPVFYMLLIIWK